MRSTCRRESRERACQGPLVTNRNHSPGERVQTVSSKGVLVWLAWPLSARLGPLCAIVATSNQTSHQSFVVQVAFVEARSRCWLLLLAVSPGQWAPGSQPDHDPEPSSSIPHCTVASRGIERRWSLEESCMWTGMRGFGELGSLGGLCNPSPLLTCVQ